MNVRSFQGAGVTDARRTLRIFIAVWIGTTAGVVSWYFWTTPRALPSDFHQVWAGARALLDGLNPYAEVGPGKQYQRNVPLLYPLPAVLAAVPFAVLPIRLADSLFVAVGGGALAWALTRKNTSNPQLFLFASAAYLFAVQTSQWSPLMLAAILQPALHALLACKPQVAVALLAAYPSPRAFVGAAAFAGASVIVFPWWPSEWFRVLPYADHMTPYVLRVSIGGPLILLGALKWKRPEARLLLALGSVPHTPLLYEALPLFLVARRVREAVVLCVGTVVATLGVRLGWPFEDHDDWILTNAPWVFWCVYVPALAFVLARPNSHAENSTPAVSRPTG